MTNLETIRKAAIENHVISAAEAESLTEIPFHSRSGWLTRGRKVRNQEEPTAVVTLWQRGKESEANPAEAGDGAKYYRHKTGLYTVEQTDRYIKIESEVS